MKMLKLITAALLATLALAACNKEDDAPTGGFKPGQVDIRTSIVSTPAAGTRATLDDNGSGTFDDDDEINLVVYGGNNTPTNFPYSKNNPLTWEKIKRDAGEAATYTFCGWYNTNPYAFSMANPTFNAATATDPDLLLATPATVAEGETVNLPFHHAMHRLIIQMSCDIAELGVTHEQFVAAKASLLNMNAAAAVDVKTGTVTPGEATDADGDYGTKTGLPIFIIAPQKVTSGTEWIKIELADMTFVYKMPATLKGGTPLTQLESGKQLTLMLTLKKTPAGDPEVVLSGHQISGWINENEIDGELNLGEVNTLTDLNAAIANATSTDPANPTRITLGSDITITSPIDLKDAGTQARSGAATRYIEIDGNGKCLSAVGNNEVIFRIYENYSLTLKNIQLEGDKASCIYLEKGAAILESGTTVTLKSGNNTNLAAVNVPEGSITLKEGATVTSQSNSRYAVFCGSYLAKLHLEGGTVSGHIVLTRPSITVAKALPDGFNGQLYIILAINNGELIQAAGGYTLTEADRSKFTIVSVSDMQGNDVTSQSSLYLDAASNTIKLQIGNDTPATSGTIDMTGKNAGQVKNAIDAALAAGITELKLTGPIANSGMDGTAYSSPFYINNIITKIDLTEVTGWEAVDCDNNAQTTETVAGLPGWAFTYCTNLTEVKLPAGVKAIGKNAFENCKLLTTINLESVTHVGRLAFNGCTALAAVSLNEAITIYEGAFNATGLTSVVLPKATAISVGDGTGTGSFGNCKALTSFDASLLTDIGKGTFMNSDKLETVKAPKAETIGVDAFGGCAALKNVELESAITIGKTVFSRCRGLTTVKLPKATTIGDRAFSDCSAVTTIELPKATTIGNSAFDGCSAVTTIELPAATKFGSSILNGCGKLTRLVMSAPDNLTDFSGQSISGSTISNDSNYFTPFNPAACDLVLNTNKRSGNGGVPAASGSTWCDKTWKTIEHR